MEISTNGLIFSKLVPSEVLAEANVKELRFLRKATESLVQQKVLCNWGKTLKQSSAVHIQALVSADGILPGSSSKLRLLVINLASVPGRQLVNSPTAQSLERYAQVHSPEIG